MHPSTVMQCPLHVMPHQPTQALRPRTWATAGVPPWCASDIDPPPPTRARQLRLRVRHSTLAGLSSSSSSSRRPLQVHERADPLGREPQALVVHPIQPGVELASGYVSGGAAGSTLDVAQALQSQPHGAATWTVLPRGPQQVPAGRQRPRRRPRGHRRSLAVRADAQRHHQQGARHLPRAAPQLRRVRPFLPGRQRRRQCGGRRQARQQLRCSAGE
mmetsp:Transcript_3928/g.13925  ORF Transcript_3928/g.13925 Transcript_3928/m.13925 type:complete len:216 (+) Transcript_3928:287-934(+)|eukprot:scaffold3659_cov338-Prasinococcus_capsulatus_cf.AAC.3